MGAAATGDRVVVVELVVGADVVESAGVPRTGAPATGVTDTAEKTAVPDTPS